MTTGGLLILALVGVFAGAINTIAGGGSLITLPVMILLGLPAGVANGTNRVGVILQSAVATWQFKREGALNARMGLWLLLPTCLGALAGAMVSVELDEALFKRLIGVVMLIMLVVVIVRPKRWLEGKKDDEDAPKTPKPTGKPTWWQALTFLAVGFYGGFLQAGVGIFLLAALVLATGEDLVRSNAIKAMLVCAFTVLPLAIFLYNDMVQWVPGLALAAGSMLGAWLGTRLTVSWGPRFVRVVLILVVSISSTKLLGLW